MFTIGYEKTAPPSQGNLQHYQENSAARRALLFHHWRPGDFIVYYGIFSQPRGRWREGMDFAKSLKTIRQGRKMSLQELANLSGVSKSMISKIERCEKNPTLQVAADIANALGVTISQMIDEKQYNSVILIKKDDRVIYRDDISGFQREQLSPTFDNYGIEFILYKIPPQQKSPNFRPHQPGINECLTVTKGKLLILLEESEYLLENGDSIFFEANVKHQFINAGAEECHYYLVRDSNNLTQRSI